MSLTVGIVGLPNVGKSTLFNALLKRQIADTAPYPFTTIKPHTGVVEVPDNNLVNLADAVAGPAARHLHHVSPANKHGAPATEAHRRASPAIVPATVTFIDIAGLVKNAHKGEGLGNEFLGQIRNVDAIVHVIRAFEDGSVPHVMGEIDPERDREIVNLELEIAGIAKPTIEWINGDKQEFENVDKLIKQAYELLGLITFYTIKGGKEVRAWSIKQATSALDAAGVVHTDFAQNFIKAEVIEVGKLLEEGSWNKAKEKGKVRLEGKDYVVQDKDVVEFKTGK